MGRVTIRARHVAIASLLLLIAIGIVFVRAFEARPFFGWNVIPLHFSVRGDTARGSHPSDVRAGEQSVTYTLKARASQLVWFGSQLGVRWSAEATAELDGQAVPLDAFAQARSAIAEWLKGEGPATGEVQQLKSKAMLRSLSSGVGHAYDLRTRPALTCVGITLLLLSLLVTFVIACIRWRRDVRRLRGCCTTCGYPRLPDPKSPCPECGTVPTDVAAQAGRAELNPVPGRRPDR